MKSRCRSRFIFVCGFLVCAVPFSSFAVPGEVLKEGATLKDVLGSWGEPEEKIEKGVKREVVWRYKQGAYVVFKNGRLASSHIGDEAQSRQEKKAAQAAVADEAKKKAEAAVESKDVLRDIVREIPSGAEAPYTEPQPPSNDPNVAGLIPNPIPQRGGPPGIAPVPIDEGEEG